MHQVSKIGYMKLLYAHNYTSVHVYSKYQICAHQKYRIVNRRGLVMEMPINSKDTGFENEMP